MSKDEIKRNSLDYILTDTLPVELSELFTYYHFYDYLLQQHKSIENMEKIIVQNRHNANSDNVPFKDGSEWASVPLQYSIIKADGSLRQMGVPQPNAALEIYLFIKAYQDEILNYLHNNSVFSLRYHVTSKSLNYKSRQRAVTQYFSKLSKTLGNGILQQTGMYFDLKPYHSLVDFMNSDEWYHLNLKFNYFAKIDYKACFDSIYTHTFVWLVSKDVNDSMSFKNTSLFATIDRILMNINARSSNGIIVGPEFSRMIAEILLQGIDVYIYNALLNDNKVLRHDYTIKRYVDDFYIFTNSEHLLDEIISLYNNYAKQYHLQLNISKELKSKLPAVLNPWLQQLSEYSTNLSNTLFRTKEELNEETTPILKASQLYSRKSVLKRNFNILLCQNEKERKNLVTYVLGTLLNKTSAGARSTNPFFRPNVSAKTVYEYIDYVFYIYAHFPSFDNTQRIISIISYLNDIFHFSRSNEYHGILQLAIKNYSFIFHQANLPDIINLILLCAKCNIEIPYIEEKQLEKELQSQNNPILWATYLVYSKYDPDYFGEIRLEIERIIDEKMQVIACKSNIFMYKEFWWLLIFNKCPYISEHTQQKFNDIIDERCIAYASPTKVPTNMAKLLFDYMKTSEYQFFTWKLEQIELLKQITYRTYERTIFRNHKYGSLSWGSIE